MTHLIRWAKSHPIWTMFGLVMVYACLLTLPQLLTGHMTLGADFLFHYNRFYETAKQLQTGDFSYFISIFGFQQSGRIINALYGPIFAYLQGGLLLLAGTWFRYQVLSNIVLGVIAGLSLDALLRTVRIRFRYRLALSLLFMTTYGIRYWWMVQGFSSWGVALFPLCFIPAIRVLQTGKVPTLTLGGAVALMLQVHVLSAVFLVFAYLPVFAYAWWQTKDKWTFIRDGLFAIGIFVLLTPNIWWPLFDLYRGDQLKPPFVNNHLAEETITWWRKEFLIRPLPLVFFIGWQIYQFIRDRKKTGSLERVVMIPAMIFLLASTNLLPWQWAVGKQIGLIDLIQFPFRFFYYATPLILLLVGIGLMRMTEQRTTWLRAFLAGSVLLAMGQVFYDTKVVLDDFARGVIPEERHTIRRGSWNEIEASFHDRDVSKTLQLMEKSTPDYIPVHKEKSQRVLAAPEANSYYDLYRLYVLENRENLTLQREGKDLVMTVSMPKESLKILPVFLYQNSQLDLDGRRLSTDEIRFTKAGNPVVRLTAGSHELRLRYHEPGWLIPLLIWTVLAWMGYAISWYTIKETFK